MGKSSGVGLLVCLQVWRTSCVLQCVAVRCSVLQCGALWCSVVQWVVACCGVLQCAAVCCSVLQCVALCCSVLQCDAICCSVLQYVANISNVERSCCSLFFVKRKKRRPVRWFVAEGRVLLLIARVLVVAIPVCANLWICIYDVYCIFKVGMGITRTNTDSQWNPLYNAFHRILWCGNETIRRLFCKRDLDAANLRPALEQCCGKQTPSDKKLFFRANLLYVPNIKM